MAKLKSAVILTALILLVEMSGVMGQETNPLGQAMRGQNFTNDKSTKPVTVRTIKQTVNDKEIKLLKDNQKNIKNQYMLKTSTKIGVDSEVQGFRANHIARKKMPYFEKEIIMPDENELKQFNIITSTYVMKIISIIAVPIEAFKDWGFYGKEMPSVNKNMDAEGFIALLLNLSKNTTFYHLFSYTFEITPSGEKWLSVFKDTSPNKNNIEESSGYPEQPRDGSTVIGVNIKALTKKSNDDIFLSINLKGYNLPETKGFSSPGKEQNGILSYSDDIVIIGGKNYFEGYTLIDIEEEGSPSEYMKKRFMRHQVKSYIFLVSMWL